MVTKKIIAANSCLDLYFDALVIGLFFISLISVQNRRKDTPEKIFVGVSRGGESVGGVLVVFQHGAWGKWIDWGDWG